MVDHDRGLEQRRFLTLYIGMKFKEWILGEMASFSLNGPIQVYEADSANGPFHISSYNASAIDMRFEDYSIEGQRPPQGNWAAPLADGRFIVYTAARPHQTVVDDRPGAVDPRTQQFVQYPVIRQDWARFAEIISGNTVVKPAQYDRPDGNAGTFKPLQIHNPMVQNPSRLQSA